MVEYTRSEILDRSRYLYGIYEYVYASAFIGQITRGSIVVDIGANIGEYTMLAAVTTGAGGRVLAVEPNKTIHARIRRNLELNQFSNVALIPAALGSAEGEAVLSVPHDGSALGTLRPGADQITSTSFVVPVRRLDDLVPEPDRHRLSAIKVDVEGWELEVFIGGRDTIQEGKPVILYECGVEEFEKRANEIKTPSMAFLEGLGYENHTVRMDRRGMWRLRLIESGDDPRSEREPWSVLMVVAVHPETRRRSMMSGQSQLERCGVFEMFARD